MLQAEQKRLGHKIGDTDEVVFAIHRVRMFLIDNFNRCVFVVNATGIGK